MNTQIELAHTAIQHHSFYFLGGRKYINFVNLSDEEAQLVLDWRNHPIVRKWMFSSIPITQKEHFTFPCWNCFSWSFRFLCRSCLLPVSPFLPNILMNIFDFVPLLSSLPVNVRISYVSTNERKNSFLFC